jgi:hypothetical protein
MCSCGQAAVVVIGPPSQRAPLCMACYKTFSEINFRHIQVLQQMRDQAERDMYLTVGLPMPDHLRPRPPVIVRQEVKDHSINVTGNVGIVNTGTIQQANVSISHVPDDNVRNVLAALSRVIEKADNAPAAQRTEALELVGAVADEAAKPPAERRLGVVKTTLSGLSQAAAGLTAAKEIWTIAEPVLRAFFGL